MAILKDNLKQMKKVKVWLEAHNDAGRFSNKKTRKLITILDVTAEEVEEAIKKAFSR